MRLKLVAAVFLTGVAVGVWYVSKFLFPDYRKPAGWPAEGTIVLGDGRQYSWTGTVEEMDIDYLTGEPVYDGGSPDDPDRLPVDHFKSPYGDIFKTITTDFFGPVK